MKFPASQINHGNPWIDLLATVWAFLGGTGLYLWWRTQTKRRDAALNRNAPGRPAATTKGANA